jgi:tetratricopeptide (TPR) repeat protein
MRQRTLVDIDILPGATRQKLQHKLLAAKNAGKGYHVVHFIGHGSVEDGVGVLFLLDEDGNSAPITAEAFSEMMDEPSLNLVMFNACETAVPEPYMYSLAEATLRQGVPAVIGMQAPIPDRLAVEFARDFYGAWANGEPIEAALAYARQLVVTETPGTAADWVIPVLYMSPTEGLALKLEQPPKPQPLLVRAVKNVYVLSMALFAILVLIFIEVPQLNQAIRTKVPVVQCVFPYKYENEFVVAVSKFVVVDEDGSPVRSARGEQLAEELYYQLNTQIEGLNLNKATEVRPPDETCPIKGLTYADRESAAAKYADRSDTNVIVYGVITDTVPSKVALEFYVNYRGFREGQEITGKHELGEPLSVYDFEAKPLRARVFALNFITIGLAHYVRGEFIEAIEYFEKAEQVDGWLYTAGKEVVYLLLGNSLARIATREKTPQYTEQALAYYNFALEECNPDYARAKVGQAGMYYLQALGDPDNPSFDQVDEELLAEAEAAYRQALTMADAPESAHIPAKVDFNLGQIYIVRAKIHEQNPQEKSYWLHEAESLFEKVIQENESGNVDLEELVGHAYAKLALVAWAQGDRDLAISHQGQAIAFFENFWHGYYAAVLGDMYAVRGQTEEARESYQRAIAVANGEGDQSSHDRYAAKLEALAMDK